MMTKLFFIALGGSLGAPLRYLINDLMKVFFNKDFDKNGDVAFSGKINIKILNKFNRVTLCK